MLVLDGKMKNARQVWSCRDVGELKFAGMDGSVVTVSSNLIIMFFIPLLQTSLSLVKLVTTISNQV